MNSPPPAAPAWSLSGHRASCPLGGLVSTIDLDRPGAGLEVARPGTGTADHLLGIDVAPDCRCVDVWPRGGDLTAVYETPDAGRLRATAMWRAVPAWLDAAAGAWCREVVVSAQTSLLESVPRIGIGADVAAGDVTPLTWHDGVLGVASRHLSPHGFLVSWPDDRALLFLVHPLDARRVEARAEATRVRITASVFPSAVEKGVLLRSRVIAAIGPAGGAIASESWAATLSAAFASSPPVLTT